MEKLEDNLKEAFSMPLEEEAPMPVLRKRKTILKHGSA